MFFRCGLEPVIRLEEWQLDKDIHSDTIESRKTHTHIELVGEHNGSLWKSRCMNWCVIGWWPVDAVGQSVVALHVAWIQPSPYCMWGLENDWKAKCSAEASTHSLFLLLIFSLLFPCYLQSAWITTHIHSLMCLPFYLLITDISAKPLNSVSVLSNYYLD